HHQVRLGVERQERQRRLRALRDVAAVQNARVPREIRREDDIRRSKPPGIKRAPQKRTDWHSAATGVIRVDVLVAGGIVELLLTGADEDVAVRELTVIDLWAGDFDRDARYGRQVLD